MSMSFPNEYEPEADYPEYEPEAIRGRSRPGTRPSGPQGVGYRPQPQAAYVTKAELQAVTDRIDRDAAATRSGLTQLGTRIDAVGATHTRDVARLRQEFRQQSEMSVLLPLLMKPQTVTLTGNPDPMLPQGTKVVVDKGDTLTMMLPLLLLGGGMGGGSTQGGLLGGDNTMMLAALAIAFSK